MSPQKSSRTCVAASFQASISWRSLSRSSRHSFSTAMRSTTSTTMASVKPATTYVMVDSLRLPRVAFFWPFYAHLRHSSAEGEFSEVKLGGSSDNSTELLSEISFNDGSQLVANGCTWVGTGEVAPITGQSSVRFAAAHPHISTSVVEAV